MNELWTKPCGGFIYSRNDPNFNIPSDIRVFYRYISLNFEDC